jgi:glycerate kinase
MRASPSSVTWLVAPDSFKGTFSAGEVATALAEGIRATSGSAEICPLADGGEGTLDVLRDALGGSIAEARARDPLRRWVEARFGILNDGSTAIVETAEASGPGRLARHERDAEAASSVGTGDLILAAARAGARRILVAAGGSACTDGGLGAIEAIHDGGGLAGASLEVLCDSLTPFDNAAAMFGPQKGADQNAVLRLSCRLAGIADRLPRDPRGVSMSGCAGGLSGGLWASFNARLRSGAGFVLDAVCFDERAREAGRVLTGEGRLDHQSAEGKLISVVARRAASAQAATHAIVGRCLLSERELRELGVASVTEASSVAELRNAAAHLCQASADASAGGLAR